MADGGPPAPRGRGAALLAILRKKEAAQAVGVQPPDEPKPEERKPKVHF